VKYLEYRRNTMAKIEGIEKREVIIEVTKEAAFEALSRELGVYSYLKSYRDDYYAIKNNSLVYFTDVSYHGSPHYEEKVVTYDPVVIKNFQILKELAKINEIYLH
jgi:hypothetical protein